MRHWQVNCSGGDTESFVQYQQTQLFKALAHPSRLRILNILSRRTLCVRDLRTVLGLSQPFLSRHLACLRKANLVRTQRDGAQVVCSLERTHLSNCRLHFLLRENFPLSPLMRKLREAETLTSVSAGHEAGRARWVAGGLRKEYPATLRGCSES
jgi:DNA-binding transcriptional ArsR family regulator